MVAAPVYTRAERVVSKVLLSMRGCFQLLQLHVQRYVSIRNQHSADISFIDTVDRYNITDEQPLFWHRK